MTSINRSLVSSVARLLAPLALSCGLGCQPAELEPPPAEGAEDLSSAGDALVTAPGELPTGGRTYGAPWAAGFTSFMPFSLGTQAYYIIYNSATGLVHFDRVLAGGTGYETVFAGTWAAGWTHFVPFTLSGQAYFIAYNQQTGLVHFDRVLAGGAGSETVWTGTWGTGFTHFAPFDEGGAPRVIAYQQSTGLVHFDRIGPALNGVEVAWEGNWGAGWTSFVPYKMNGENRLLAYNAATGLAHFDRIVTPGLTGVNVLATANWAGGFTNVVGFPVDGQPHFLAYRSAHGEAHLDRFVGDGMQMERPSRWATGYTHVVPLVAGNQTFLARYNQNAGGAEFLRLNATGDHLACNAAGTTCRVRDMPRLLQTDPTLPVDVAAHGPSGCYDASIAMVIRAALLNRTSGGTPAGRTADFLAINGLTQAATNRDLLTFVYRRAENGDPFYIHEALGDTGAVASRQPAGCNPRLYASCGSAEGAAGDAYRVWLNGEPITSDYFIAGLRQKVMQIVAFTWQKKTTVGGVTTYEFDNNAHHKVVVSGYQPGAFPLLINDPGSGTEVSARVGVLHASPSLKLPNDAATWPYLEYASRPGEFELLEHYDGLRLQ